MKVFNFFIASVVYLIGVGVICFVLGLGDYTLQAPFFSYTLPVYAWLMGVVGLYAVLALLHMVYHSTKLYWRAKAIAKDSRKLKKFVLDTLLERSVKTRFTSKEFSLLSTYVDEICAGSSSDEDIVKALQTRAQIKSGTVASLDGYGLSKQNPLYEQNELNKAKTNLSYAKKLLKSTTTLSTDIERAAYRTVLEQGSYDDIRALNVPKSAQDIIDICTRFEQLGLSAASVQVLLANPSLDSKDILALAHILVSHIEPAALSAIFDGLDDERYLRGHLYVLAYFGNYDKLRTIYQESQKQYQDVDIILCLHSCGQKFDLKRIFHD